MGVWCSCWASSLVAPPFCGGGGGKVDCGTLLIGGLPPMLILHPYLQFGSIWGVKFLDFLSIFWFILTVLHARGCLHPMKLLFLCSPLCKHPLPSCLHACCDLCSEGLDNHDTDEHSTSLQPFFVCVWFTVSLPVCHAPLDRVLVLMNAAAAGLNWMLLVVLFSPVFSDSKPNSE